jgi:hypothetical protein
MARRLRATQGFNHPIFGIAIEVEGPIAQNGNIPAQEAVYGYNFAGDVSEEIKDKIARQTGISSEQVQNQRYINALANPGNFLTDKNADLERIKGELAREYRNEVFRRQENGDTYKDSEKAALKFVDELKIRLFKEHTEKFPKRIADSVIDKIGTR